MQKVELKMTDWWNARIRDRCQLDPLYRYDEGIDYKKTRGESWLPEVAFHALRRDFEAFWNEEVSEYRFRKNFNQITRERRRTVRRNTYQNKTGYEAFTNIVYVRFGKPPLTAVPR